MTSQRKPRVSFLGPVASYTHQVSPILSPLCGEVYKAGINLPDGLVT